MAGPILGAASETTAMRVSRRLRSIGSRLVAINADVFRIACTETGWHLRSTPIGAPRAYAARWRSGSN
jgi:hypothetical protein